MAQPIVILGAGFAAVTAIRQLRRFGPPDLEITLVAPKPEFVYLPSLIWIPTGQRRGRDLTVNLQSFLQQNKIKFFPAQVTGLREGGRIVRTDKGEVENDALLIASGGRFIKKLPGIEHAVTLCEGIPAAEQIRDKLRSMEGGKIAFGFAGNPQEPAAMRGGPMFELMLGIDTWLRRHWKRDNFELTFFSPAPKPGQRMGDKAAEHLLAELADRGIQIHLGHKMVRFEEGKVVTEGGEVAADLICFMPGLTGPAWLAQSGLELSPGGFVQADAYCRAVGMERLFVAGDAGSFPGPDWLPKQAHMADLQAKAAVENLLDALRGKGPAAIPKTELVCMLDHLDGAMLVYRSEKRSFMLPGGRLFHWGKRFFEQYYIKQFG